MQYTYTVYNIDDFQFVTATSIWLFTIDDFMCSSSATRH